MNGGGKKPHRGPGRQGFLQRHGVQPWMVWLVVALGVSFAATLYWINRGGGLGIPAPRNVELPSPV